MLSLGHVRQILDYNPLTGVFLWKQRVALRVQVGDEAGSIGDKGYRVISIKNRDYKAHQLAWFYMTGEWPDRQIDHKNGVRADNRWANLRLATPLQNAQNSSIRKDNTSGHKGVTRRPNGRWQVVVQCKRKRHHIGTFDEIEQAALAYAEAAKRLHGEFARVV